MINDADHATGRPETGDLAAEAVRRACAVFGGNLILAFVGGSRASGVHRDDSDIDAFVLLERSDRERETEYALALRAMHEANDLFFDHYGEIFDRATLDSLLGFTEMIDETIPEMAKAPCYQGNCLLSIYRKGRVVLEFLAGPKVHILDPRRELPELERRSLGQLSRCRTDLPAPASSVIMAHGTEQSRLLDQWKFDEINSDGLDTPVGVGLRRWFGRALGEREKYLTPDRKLDVGSATTLECPLTRGAGPLRLAYSAQCLSTHSSQMISDPNSDHVIPDRRCNRRESR